MPASATLGLAASAASLEPASAPVSEAPSVSLADLRPRVPVAPASAAVPEELSVSLADLRPGVPVAPASAAVPEELSVSLADLRVAAPVPTSSAIAPAEPDASSMPSVLPPPGEPDGSPARASSSKDPGDSLEGVTIGRYVLRHMIAQGGMAAVYLAQLTGDEGFARWVAIKIIHPHLARDPRFVTMFLDEARIASRIGHPNVCAVLDYGSGPPPHLVMEHLHGEPLSTLGKAAAARGGVPVWLALRVVADAARGLHAAHELRGADGKPLEVVHRDVSMQNVFVLYDGLTKVLDFGVAKARNRVSATETGELKGKIAYMAPDVLGGSPADRRADVWGLGVVLWEILAHRRLFRGPNEAITVHNVLHRKVPMLASLRSDIPPGLDAILQRALERDPARRIQSAAQLADQLEAQLHMAGVPAGPAQIATWMADVLAERKATRERLLGALASGLDAAIAREGAALGSDDLLEPSDAHELALAAVPPRRRAWALGVLAAGILGAGAVGWLAAGPTPGALEPEPSTPTPQSTSTAITASSAPTSGPGPSTPPELAGVVAPTVVAPSVVAPSVVAPSGVAPSSGASITSAGPASGTSTGESGASAGPAPSEPTPPAPVATERGSEPSRPPRPEGERVRPSTGTLNLMAVPPAEVFLGGRSLGRTPLVNVSLPAGRHRLTLRPIGGGAERTTSVTIRPGARTLESVR